jgi:hypothetical protein
MACYSFKEPALTVRAHVRNFHLNTSDIVTGISKVRVRRHPVADPDPCRRLPQGAPAPGAPPFNVHPAIPVIGDTVVIKGVVRTVKAVDPRAVSGLVVRVHMIVEG